MNWIDAALFIGVLIGVVLLVILVARSPTFWASVFVAILADAFPYIKDYVERRNTPKVEEEMHEATRRAQEWDNFNKRPKDK